MKLVATVAQTASVLLAQMDFDAVGHYARPDVFALRVNTSPQQSVRLGDDAPEGNA